MTDVLDPRTPTERKRLGLVEDEQDPATTALLTRLGAGAGWRCVEVGAGAGSIALWLASRCAHVVAVDRKPTLADPPANVELVVADVAQVELPERSFDLVHARAVLTHVRERGATIRRMTSWLRPGGWLVVTDPASFPVDSSPYPLVRKAGKAAAAVVRTRIGTDPTWARTLPKPLVDAGLVDVDAECTLRMMRGGTREAVMMDLMYEQLGELMLQTKLITAGELAELHGLLNDESYVDLPPAVIRSWGRRP